MILEIALQFHLSFNNEKKKIRMSKESGKVSNFAKIHVI